MEALAAGSLTLTASGAKRRVVCVTRHPIESGATPTLVIRVAAKSLGDARPEHAFDLSPETLVRWDGHRIPAQALVNGATITRETSSGIDHRWIVTVEGPMENEGGAPQDYAPLFDGTGFVHDDADTPALVDETHARVAAKQRLVEIAAELGHTLSGDPDLHIEVDGIAIEARSTRTNRYIFALPKGADALTLVSRVWVPADVVPDSDDERRLGVCVRRLVLDGRELDLADLETGWDKIEDHGDLRLRWTKGAALVPLVDPRFLDVELCGAQRYWVRPNSEGATGLATRARTIERGRQSATGWGDDASRSPARARG